MTKNCDTYLIEDDYRTDESLMDVFDVIAEDLIKTCGNSAKPFIKDFSALVYDAQYFAEQKFSKSHEELLRMKLRKMEDIIRELQDRCAGQEPSPEIKARMANAFQMATEANKRADQAEKALEKAQKEVAAKQATIEMYNNAANQNNSVVAAMTKKNLDLEAEVARLTAENTRLERDVILLSPKARKLSL